MYLLQLLLSRTIPLGRLYSQWALNTRQRAKPNHRDREENKECHQEGHDQFRGEKLVALEDPAVWQGGVCLENVFLDGPGRYR